MSAAPLISPRQTFTTSRLLEYFSGKELQAQVGFPPEAWPVALLKELIDNSLDACEAAGETPVVNVAIDGDGFEVVDNGPGLPAEVVEAALDFAVRVSSNSRYVSPTRGQLGNALKCVIAAPAVLFPDSGRGVVIEARGVRHEIRVRADPIAQEPRVEHVRVASTVKTGTRVRVDWPEVSSSLLDDENCDFYRPVDVADAFAALNPHAAITFGGEMLLEPDAALRSRWTASEPTSPHWYDEQQFAGLIAAHVHRSRTTGQPSPSLRDFVRTFHGLTGTARARAVLEQCHLAGRRLADLTDGGEIDMDAVAALLGAMKAAARPVKPKALGWVGEQHWRRAADAFWGIEQASARYRVLRGDADGRPFVVEAFLALRDDDDAGRVVLCGLNWSPALSIPLGEIRGTLEEASIDDDVGVFVGVHVITPLVGFTDRGKARASLPRPITQAVSQAILSVSKEVTRQRHKQRREETRLNARARKFLTKHKAEKIGIRDAAWQVIPEAIAHVTGGDLSAPAKARQIMYAARKRVLELTGGRCWARSQQFTQSYLPDFIRENPDLTAGWNVVYDARGQLTEPHTGRVVPLGTVAVRDYVRGWTQPGTSPAPSAPATEPPRLADMVQYQHQGTGPLHRYRFALVVEKEGFDDLLRHARIAERFDLAIAPTKGLSTTATRSLVEELSRRGVVTLVLHDFDKSGFSILHTLRADTRRYTFAEKPLVVDLGLRLTDVQEMGLEGEPVDYRMDKDPREQLAMCGATRAEQEFLVHHQAGRKLWQGRRVELNELTNAQFVAFLERKLTEAGVEKVVPDDEALRQAYIAATRDAYVRRDVEHARRRALAEAAGLTIEVPDNLAELVRRRIEGTALSWDDGLAEVLRERLDGR